MRPVLHTLIVFGAWGILSQLQAFRPISVAPDSDIALSGFDVVSYHVAKAPQKGHPSFQVKWSGAYWRFASQTNMRKFKANPKKFAPEFGGYCASGMAGGGEEVHACNPTVYTFQEGRLIVFSSQAELERWKANPDAALEAGLKKYQALLTESDPLDTDTVTEG